MNFTHFASETVVVVDLGSSYVQILARRIRESGVYSIVVPHTISTDDLKRLAPKGIVLSGSPASLCKVETAVLCDPKIFDLGIPVLGICYGMQFISHTFGVAVQPAVRKEFGPVVLELSDIGVKSPLFAGMPRTHQVAMYHSDCVSALPNDFELLASSADCPLSAIKHKSRPIYGVQMHPEIADSTHGKQLFRNFVEKICGCRCDWTMKRFSEAAIDHFRNEIGKDHVICGLSGGVDSSVVAAILSKAVGKQLKCIVVDTGLMRKNEIADVMKAFETHFHLDTESIDASGEFLRRLAGVTEPQEKRKRIGHYFIDVFAEAAKKHKDAKYLAQGTIYPDIIESGATLDINGVNLSAKPKATIKLHHNVGGLPEKLNFKLVEPLRELFKDEVRQLGIELGLPADFVWRHPFPGPGLGVRCLGEVTKEKLDRLREADAIVIEEIRNAGIYREMAQAFVSLLPVKAVGVRDECRTYEDAVAIRCITTEDFMTAECYPLPYDLLRKMSDRIVHEVPGVNRVLYDVSTKPPGTIEWE